MLTKLMYLIFTDTAKFTPLLPTFTADPVEAHPPCGLQQNNEDYWTLKGTMKIPDKTGFKPEIKIRTTENHWTVNMTFVIFIYKFY